MTAVASTVSGISLESDSEVLGTLPVTVRSSRKHLRLYLLRERWVPVFVQSSLAA